jgi:hypothetical protein
MKFQHYCHDVVINQLPQYNRVDNWTIVPAALKICRKCDMSNEMAVPHESKQKDTGHPSLERPVSISAHAAFRVRVVGREEPEYPRFSLCMVLMYQAER